MKHFTKTAAGLAALVALIISAPANATLPTPADAISLKNAINNNTVAIAYLPGNSAIISTLLPKMGDCTAVFTVAKNNMDAEISYYAGGGRDVPTLNNYRAQVNSALAGGTACAVPPQTPGDVFNANGVKYTNIGYPSNSFVTALITTTNNMPSNLKTRLAAAYNAGWRFYIFRTPDDFKASALYKTLGVTQADYDQMKIRAAFTSGNADKVQIYFENFYDPKGGLNGVFANQANHPTATIVHETEHVNDARLGALMTPPKVDVSSTDAGFVNAYNLGKARYLATAGANKDLGANFVTNPSGKAELFAELATYWDTGHWGVSGVSAQMAGTLYTSAEVLKFFPEAQAYMVAKKTANTW